MMAVELLFGLDALSIWELLFGLICLIIFAVLLPYITVIAAVILLIPFYLLATLLEILYMLFDWVGDQLLCYVKVIFGANDNQPAAAEPTPPDPINEAWVRSWMDQMDEASDEHLQQVLSEYE